MSASIIPTSSPRSLSILSLSLSISIFLFRPLASPGLFSILCHRRMASILPVVQHVAFSRSLSLFSEAPSFFSVALSFAIVLFLLFFSSAFSLSALPSDHPRAPDARFLPAVPTGHAARLFSSHLLCKRTQSRPTTPARCTLPRRRLPRNLRTPRTRTLSHACARTPGLNIQTLATCLFFR